MEVGSLQILRYGTGDVRAYVYRDGDYRPYWYSHYRDARALPARPHLVRTARELCWNGAILWT
jgi:hypothetical protein